MEQREAKLPRTFKEKETQRRLIVVLDGAQLETVKIGNDYQLLNCDDHQSVLRKRKRDENNDARPDITHQVCFLKLSIFVIFGNEIIDQMMFCFELI